MNQGRKALRPYKLALLVWIALAPLGTGAAEWRITAIDITGVGQFSSLKFDAAGNGHVVYSVEDGLSSLKYGFWDHNLKRWLTMLIARGATSCALVLDAESRPHVSYADAGTAKGAKLHYARWDGTKWNAQAIPVNADVIAFYTSIALDADGNPVISFYEYEGPGGIGFVLRLRAVRWNGSHWEVRTVDQQPGSGKFNSMASDSSGRPHIAYANVKAEYAGLRYARWNGNAWEKQILEGAETPSYVASVALAMDGSNTPHISYTDVARRVVKYATLREGKWITEPVDAIGKDAYPDRNGIAVDDRGTPYMTYFDAAAGVLKMAWRTNGRWMTESIDGGGAGFTSSIQVTTSGIWITYADQSGALKCAQGAAR
jgi:hypothetical protein